MAACLSSRGMWLDRLHVIEELSEKAGAQLAHTAPAPSECTLERNTSRVDAFSLRSMATGAFSEFQASIEDCAEACAWNHKCKSFTFKAAGRGVLAGQCFFHPTQGQSSGSGGSPEAAASQTSGSGTCNRRKHPVDPAANGIGGSSAGAAHATPNKLSDMELARLATARKGLGCIRELARRRPASFYPSESPWMSLQGSTRGGTPSFDLCEERDGLEIARQIVESLLLLGSTDMFVGKFTSNLDRIAFALMVSRSNGCLPPYVSLDSAWCFQDLNATSNVRGKLFVC